MRSQLPAAFRPRFLIVPIGILLLTAGYLAIVSPISAGGKSKEETVVNVPEADRFVPFALTIRSGQSVRWVNNDEDDHGRE